MKTDRDIAPPREHASWLSSFMRCLGPFLVLVIIGRINGIGAWPTFRQQDTSLLHWILASNSEALKGLSQGSRPEGADYSNNPRRFFRNYLTLENMNLSGLDLSSSDLSDMSVENVSLAGARLVNADFSCTDISRVNLSGAKLMNSRLDYSRCKEPEERHTSTKGLHCSQEVINEVNNANLPFGPSDPDSFTCLETALVGADFSGALIRGDEGRRSLDDKSCKQLLVLVGNMSGAVFNEANLTCVALIHQPDSPAPKQTNSNDKLNTFNGVSFTGARLDRVSLVKGPFRFSQFERAKLMGLFLNIDTDKADIDYSRFNEIKCKRIELDHSPCLWVYRRAEKPEPLHLNLLWSTLVTNLKPTKEDSFLCTPPGDLPAWVENKRVDSAGYWLTIKTKINSNAIGKSTIDKPIELECPSTHLLSTEAKLPSNH